MYGKIFECELDSTMAEQPPVTRLVWHYMLMLKDEDGRVDMTAAAFARRTNIPLSDVEVAAEALSSPDPLSRTPDAEGRRILPIEGQPYGWQVVNHALYRAMGNREDRRRQNREAQQRWRDRQQGEDNGGGGEDESAPVIVRKQESASTMRNKPSDADADADADAGEEATPPARRPANGATGREFAGPPVLVYPVTASRAGGETEWGLAEAKITEWRECFPGLDVLAECRKALQWVRDNPTRRKTAKGMLRFLGGWLERAQNRRGGLLPFGSNGRPTTPSVKAPWRGNDPSLNDPARTADDSADW